MGWTLRSPPNATGFASQKGPAADGPYEPTAAGALLFLFGRFSAPPRAVCRCHQVLDFRRQNCSGFYTSVSLAVLLPCHQRPQPLLVHTMRLRPFARNWISRYTHVEIVQMSFNNVCINPLTRVGCTALKVCGVGPPQRHRRRLDWHRTTAWPERYVSRRCQQHHHTISIGILMVLIRALSLTLCPRPAPLDAIFCSIDIQTIQERERVYGVWVSLKAYHVLRHR